MNSKAESMIAVAKTLDQNTLPGQEAIEFWRAKYMGLFIGKSNAVRDEMAKRFDDAVFGRSGWDNT